ncbi:transporter substrate-binding domain-containing protein [Dactylosporangium sp. AC04546]|uniref:substrate-binding periplasmic protein n=1 Tax=Dactylosporangium sp. AC04546 TaxID=2862460 RepID=UPI001EE112B7|nr:transporter substrate-binding domain-containing protein [Dactylosporangium sp. AC04546]WVK86644.1 transporter substrate-binding domain-containing protein [Dactylosporangium sp. AC04546]
MAAAIVLGAFGLSGCADSGTDAGAAPGGCTPAAVDTVESGKITVGTFAYQPYIGLAGGKLDGLDGEILSEAAKNLCLAVVARESDWDGVLGNVQSHRVDLGIGGIGWGKERSEKGLFTDPVYYSPPAIAVVGDARYATVDDFKGKNVGTISGYLWEKAIKATDGIGQAKTYPDAVSMFSDLNNGRLDVGFIDPLLIPYEAKKNPNSKFKISYFEEPTDAQVAARPDLINYRQLQISFYLARQATKLNDALNAEIRKMYANGKLTELITKYGGDPNQFLKPAGYQSKLRTGVDRDAGWAPPTI